eukprot:11157590-Lingulodinium_polyedra.AAC.1
MLRAKGVTGGGGRAQGPRAQAALRQLPPAALADLRQVHVRIAAIFGGPDLGPIVAAPDTWLSP